MTADLSNIGARLLRYRADHRISQVELARRIGISPLALRNIEAGKAKRPRAVTLLRIADVLNAATGPKTTVDNVTFRT